MNKDVTIVIPTFNRVDLLEKTIESALKQTYPCDVIVCDHGSQDSTPEMMEKYEGKVKYIRKEVDHGISFCWLDGIINADTEFVHLHLDDDLMMPDYIEKSMKYMRDKEVGMVFSDAILKNYATGQEYPNCLDIAHKFGTGIIAAGQLEKEILENSLMLSPAVCLYRKKDMIDALYPGSLPIDFGGEYKGVGPDHFMTLLVLLRYKKVAALGESLAIFGAHDGSITIDAHANKEKAQKIQSAYNAIRKYYLVLKNARECGHIWNDKSKKNLDFLWSVQKKKKGNKQKYYFLGVNFFTIKDKKVKRKYYILGIPFFVKRIKK